MHLVPVHHESESALPACVRYEAMIDGRCASFTKLCASLGLVTAGINWMIEVCAPTAGAAGITLSLMTGRP